MKIKNYKAVVAKLTAMIVQLYKDCLPHPTDIYLYYDEETQTAELDTFLNVGGNSWLNDDHYTIYTDEGSHDSDEMWEFYQDNIQTIADAIGISEKQLASEIRQYLDEDEDYSPTIADVMDYAESNDDYMDKLTVSYHEYLDNDFAHDVISPEAERIINDYIAKMNELELTLKSN